MAQIARSRPDRCPGVVHPWPADDGGLVRIRVPGGQVATTALRALAEVAEEYGDGRVRVTGRANLQVRAMPLSADGLLARPALAALEATGLLPSRAHDRVRNVLASPQTGRAGGRADLRPVVAALDALLLGDEGLADLPGRFLFTFDDGRGDLAHRHKDLGLVALDGRTAQLRVGDHWGDVVALVDAPAALGSLARAFLAARGSGPDAAWHVPELGGPLAAPASPAPGATVATGPLPFGPVAGGRHLAVPDDGLDLTTIATWSAPTVIVTPWHGVLVPSEETPTDD